MTTLVRGISGLVVASLLSLAFGQDLGVRDTTLFGEFEEWSLANTTWSGNPYDLAATVTYTHTGTGETLHHPMFYDGANSWRFRFTGTKTGEWQFSTSSSDPQLDGRTGTINVANDLGARGFTVNGGNKWAQQTSDGDQAILPQFVMYEQSPKNYATGTKVDEDIQTFLVDHGFTGFHAKSIAGYWFEFDNSTDQVNSSMQNPDPRTFDALEQMIIKTHDAGGLVHIWAWGDTQRQQTPDSLSGGKNGAVDRRLQKYIAARLGPIPGWSMGYGFDLNEWAGASSDPSHVKSWADFINDQSAWDHLLGGRSDGPNSTQPFSLDVAWNSNFGYAGYEHHKPYYDDYVEAVDAAHNGTPLDRPVMSEDRFRIRTQGRSKDYSEEETRRGLWQATMAGGVANIWGNLVPYGNDDDRGSAPYGNKSQIKTWSTFWNDNGRFTLDLERANSLTGGDAVALSTPSRDSIYLYEEGTQSIPINLAGLGATYDIVAVDAKLGYNEFVLGQVSGNQTIALPYSSDWAISLTEGDGTPVDPGPTGILFLDEFILDPGNPGTTGREGASEAWDESDSGAWIPATVEGQQVAQGTTSAPIISLTRNVDTTGTENVAIMVTAFQASSTTYETMEDTTALTPSYADFLQVRYDTGDGAGWQSLLLDHGAWTGENDAEVASWFGETGNASPTSTATIPLPVQAWDNSALQIQVRVRSNQSAELWFLDELAVTASVIGLDGDYNGDGMVNLADYTVWRDMLGAKVAQGSGADGHPDEVIDEQDYDVWRNNFGSTTSASVNGVSVPETSSAMLVAPLLVGAIVHRQFGSFLV